MRSVDEILLVSKLKSEKEEAADSGPQSSDTAVVVAEMEKFFKRFLILPRGMALAIALWVIGTHIFELFEVFPYLGITGPAKRCGKTRLTEVLGLLCARAQRTSNVSEAALFRIIEARSPTLIIDEAEALADKRSERSQLLVGILNSGNRIGANVIRCVGPQHVVAEFRTYCPKAIVAIGALRDTLADRSISIAMQRKGRGQSVGRFLFKKVKKEAEELKHLVASMVAEKREQIEMAFVKFDFEELEDRESENWSSLLSLCEVLAPGRLLELKVTAIRNGKAKAENDSDDSLSMRLLADIALVLFGNRDDGVPSLLDDYATGDELGLDEDAGVPTSILIERLKEIEESPWNEKDSILTPLSLARMLRPFGVFPRLIDRKRGYVLKSLLACVSTYASSTRASVQADKNKEDKKDL